jgi:chromosome segregation ATPase
MAGVSLDTGPSIDLQSIDQELRSIYMGGENFLARMQAMSKLKSDTEKALADLAVGKLTKSKIEQAKEQADATETAKKQAIAALAEAKKEAAAIVANANAESERIIAETNKLGQSEYNQAKAYIDQAMNETAKMRAEAETISAAAEAERKAVEAMKATLAAETEKIEKELKTVKAQKEKLEERVKKLQAVGDKLAASLTEAAA